MGRSCDEFTPPVALIGPHSAALGMRFYTGSLFPREYRNAIFVARHGSWNRTRKIGVDIVVAKLNVDGTVKSVQTAAIFATNKIFQEKKTPRAWPASAKIIW